MNELAKNVLPQTLVLVAAHFLPTHSYFISRISVPFLPSIILRLLQRLDHLVVDQAVGGERLLAVDGEFAAGKIRDDAAGLGDDERAGGDVPRLELQFPEAVEASRGDIAEIERGGTGAADALRAARHAAEIF